MLWVTRKTIRINRSATACLIRRLCATADPMTACGDLEAVAR